MNRSCIAQACDTGRRGGFDGRFGAEFRAAARPARRPQSTPQPGFRAGRQHPDVHAAAQLAGHRRRHRHRLGDARSSPYLVELAFKSHDLKFAQVIGITQFGSRVYAKFDAVKVGGFRYPIDSIYKMTREEARNLAARHLSSRRVSSLPSPAETRRTLGRDARAYGDDTVRILVIEDDKDVASFIRNGLVQAGCNVDHAATARTACSSRRPRAYDALVVDRMLPGVDGLTVIRTLRASDNTTPVLILSALGEVDDRVKGLKAGGDDYLVKPFAFSELLARLEALARRAKSGSDAPSDVLRVADLEMDLLRREVRRDGKPIDLQPREFQLLEFLLRHAGQVVTRTMLLEGVWDYHFDPQTNVIDVHISRLRSKIDRGFDRPLLHTVRGVGYRLDG